MKIDLPVKLKYELSTILLFVSIKYSMRHLLSDLNNYAWRWDGDPQTGDMRQIR